MAKTEAFFGHHIKMYKLCTPSINIIIIIKLFSNSMQVNIPERFDEIFKTRNLAAVKISLYENPASTIMSDNDMPTVRRLAVSEYRNYAVIVCAITVIK